MSAKSLFGFKWMNLIMLNLTFKICLIFWNCRLLLLYVGHRALKWSVINWNCLHGCVRWGWFDWNWSTYEFCFAKDCNKFWCWNDTNQEVATISGFAKHRGQEFTPFFSFAEDTQCEQIGMSFGSPKQIWLAMEVNDYHLIFDLNGEGQTRSHLIVLTFSLKEFFSSCVKKFIVYIWSLVMKRNFSKHLDIITKKTCVLLSTSRILDQIHCFRNDHFLLEKLDKPIFHKNLKYFFHFFPSTTFENTLLVDDTHHNSMFNPPCNAIFFKTFYKSPIDGNYLFNIVLPYLELLHSFRMWVYKFVELNPFGNIMDVPLGDPHYEKLNAHCYAKCKEIFL